mmetsp:Transcript_47113/g.139149  ORF Transcript_47113/g.139149 Transcript_47113/m.139149 type:complete len:356 (+) Transcript_47113:142-1209(+)
MAKYGPDGLRLDDPSSSVHETDPFLSKGAHARGTRYDGAQGGLDAELAELGGKQRPQPANNRSDHWKSIVMKVAVPWGMFVLTSWTMALMPETQLLRLIGWSICFLLFALTCVLLHLHVTRPEAPEASFYYHLGMLSMMAVLMGMLVGLQVYDRNMTQYWIFSQGSEYTGVRASQPALMYSDAGALVFDESARVDLRRSFGMRPAGDDQTYCVAPVLDEVDLGKVNFWAVGRDCCEPLWGFRCDNARNPASHIGAVLGQNSSVFAEQLYKQYHKAAHQAAAYYNLYTPDSPVFVRWLDDTSEVRSTVLVHSLVWLSVSSLIALMVFVLIAAWLHLATLKGGRSSATAWSAQDRPR